MLTFNSLILGLGIVFASTYTYNIYFKTSLIKRLLKHKHEQYARMELK